MSTTQVREPLGITSTPVSAMAAFGDETGGIVVVYRTTSGDKYAYDRGQYITSGHMRQSFGVRILNARGISIGSDETLMTGEVELHADCRHKMLSTALSFLSAAAEQYSRTSTESDPIFSAKITEWAYMNSDEIAMAQSDLDEWLEEYN